MPAQPSNLSLLLDMPNRRLPSLTRRIALAVLLVAAPGCTDGTGAAPSLTGQWLLRLRMDQVQGASYNCSVAGAVRLVQSGTQVSGRMPYPIVRCVGIGGLDRSAFDSTTAVSGTLRGDSLQLTFTGAAFSVHATARVMGDSLGGPVSDFAGGVVGGRRYPDDVPLGRGNVQVSGAYTRSAQLHAYATGPAVTLDQTDHFGPAVLLRPFDINARLALGSFSVGMTGTAYYGWFYGRLENGHLDFDAQYTGGQITLTGGDAQTTTGRFDLTGVSPGTSNAVQVQGDFVAITERFPNQFH